MASTLTRFRAGILSKFGRYLLPYTELQRRPYYLYSPEPFHPIPDKQPQCMTADEAVTVVTSGNFLTKSYRMHRMTMIKPLLLLSLLLRRINHRHDRGFFLQRMPFYKVLRLSSGLQFKFCNDLIMFLIKINNNSFHINHA